MNDGPAADKWLAARPERMPADNVLVTLGEDGRPKVEGIPDGYALVKEYIQTDEGHKQIGTFLQLTSSAAPADLYADCHRAGGMSRHTFDVDPKRMAFLLARYKHTAKILQGRKNVLEVGCADGFASRIVRQHVGHLTAIDVDSIAIRQATANMSAAWPITFEVADIMDAPLPEYDAVYALDVFEHFSDEDRFLANMRGCAPVAVIGAPSLESQAYASELSRAGHVNCKTAADFKATLERYWPNVFVFSMNDETLHTGFGSMSHYLLALAVA